ncbi:hypothetical protein OF83DRAFT_1152884 [Amylostereum chailletii]|nr:hypothetical protein OF83DRAFT_1152884 [Amylostereum chailletii]
MISFSEYPCCAWILASVCPLWRRLALSMPKIWSKIRLVTSPNASADTIRLWLERSGSREPLDIEIFLQVQHSSNAPSTSRVPARSTSPWPYPNSPPVTTTHYVQIHASSVQPSTSIQIIPAAAPLVLPPSPTHHDGWGSILSPPPVPPPASLTPNPTSIQSRASTHWGHIAIWYLVQQMHRWERFVFRFDKQFHSWTALKSITGDAPLLKEFEVSCAEPVYYGEWPWLPSAAPSASVVLPELRKLTLQYTPFRWSSPMLRNNLRALNLRSLPTTNIALDRILHIVTNNKALEDLCLHFSNVLNPVLPLSSVTLPELKTLSIGGHYLMASLLDSLAAPSLQALTLDVEARDSIEDSISNLLSRSNHPPVNLLSLAYGGNGAPYYYSGGGLIASWGFLTELSQLRTLQAGSTPLDPLFTALGAPDEDVATWMCPNLSQLALKACPAHADGIPKLVQMVDMRNPEGGGGSGGPVRLRHLEMHECTSVGQDVVDWLKSRVDKVICVEPMFERTPHSPTYAYL